MQARKGLFLVIIFQSVIIHNRFAIHLLVCINRFMNYSRVCSRVAAFQLVDFLSEVLGCLLVFLCKLG